MTQDEALKLALEALEGLFGLPDKFTGGGGDVAVWRLGGSYRAQEAITSLRQAIAELGLDYEPEPVAWMDANGNISDNNDHKCFFPIPLYTTPLQRTWVGLTDEEVFEICNSLYNRDSELVQMIEAKLKERNDHSI